MYNNKVFICGVDTSKLPLLKEKEKEALLKKVKNGDNFARDELINGNLRLVLSVIQRFTGRGENIDDLFQVGCIGLIKSIDYPKCKILHIRRSNDYWRNQKIFEGQ